MSIPQVLIAAMEGAFNRYLSLDPEASDRLVSLEGRVIALDITGLGLQFYLFPAADGVMILEDFDAEADTTLTGTPLAFARLGLSDDSQSEMFAGEVKISGDLRLGRQFNNILGSLEIDWEELLSQYIGDVAAHKLGNLGRDLLAWGRRNVTSMQQNTGEYLQEEVRFLPSQAEVDGFLADVDSLRNDLSRLEARLKKLETKVDAQ